MPCSGYPIVGYQRVSRPACCTSVRSIQNWIIQQGFGIFVNSGCYVQKNIAGTSSQSVHGTGRAGDVSIVPPAPGVRNLTYSQRQDVMIFLINKYLIPHACDLGLQRMIFKGKSWQSDRSNVPWSVWQSFTGAQSHNDHLHFEVTPGFCARLSLADVTAIMREGFGDPTEQPDAPVGVVAIIPPTQSDTGTTTGSIIPANTNTGSGNSSSGRDAPVFPSGVSDARPVWSATIPANTPCTACGPSFSSLVLSESAGTQTGRAYTHCGGTGAICINLVTGATCSTGSAPTIGNFPGGIKDFIFWGNGAYGLSSDGTQVYALGGATPPVFDTTRGGTPPWSNLFIIGPDTIGVSSESLGSVNGGLRSARAKVNSIARYSCG